MTKDLIEMIVNLGKVKSIVTIILTGVFAYLSIKLVVSAEQFMTIYTMIMGFYFGTQFQKARNNSTGSVTGSDLSE